MFSGRPSWRSVCPSVRPLTPITRDAISLQLHGMDFNETVHNYLSCERALLKRFTRPEVQGQGHRKAKCTFRAEESTAATYRRPSVVRPAEALAYRLTVSRQGSLVLTLTLNRCMFVNFGMLQVACIIAVCTIWHIIPQ